MISALMTRLCASPSDIFRFGDKIGRINLLPFQVTPLRLLRGTQTSPDQLINTTQTQTLFAISDFKSVAKWSFIKLIRKYETTGYLLARMKSAIWPLLLSDAISPQQSYKLKRPA
jgi:hypothetical protein